MTKQPTAPRPLLLPERKPQTIGGGMKAKINPPFKIFYAGNKNGLSMLGTSPGKSYPAAIATLVELETGIVRLQKLRSDLSFDFIKEKVLTKAREIYEPRADNITYMDIFKALLEGLYNKALAGEPMPWELKQTIQ